MRDPARIPEVLFHIKKVWECHPDWRFCQLIVNFFGRDPFYVEDEDVIKRLEKFEEWWKENNND